MIVDEIKTELDTLKIEYPKDALKAELEELLARATESHGERRSRAGSPRPEPAEGKTAPETGPERRTVATDVGSLNIRREPGGTVVSAVPDGTELATLGEPVDGWQRVAIEAWVKAEFLVDC